MTDDPGRAQRKQLELLQARLKEAQQDLELAHTEGYLDELRALSEDARAAEAAAVDAERRAASTGEQLARVRHDVAEAERHHLAPRAVYRTSPAVAAIALCAGLGAASVMASLLSGGPTPLGYGVLAAMVVLPPPVAAWVYRRRFSGASRPASRP